MTTKHTPEPWDWHNNDVFCEITSEHRGSIGDTCGSSCLGDIALGEANARRIVKCVNAMAGIEDDNAIFDKGNSVRSVISKMAGKNADLERQLVELRSACADALNNLPADGECAELIRNALAKCEVH